MWKKNEIDKKNWNKVALQGMCKYKKIDEQQPEQIQQQQSTSSAIPENRTDISSGLSRTEYCIQSYLKNLVAQFVAQI